MTRFEVARRNMVDGQLRPNRVTDPALIEAMSTLPRELFVPRPLAGIAYTDEDIDLGGGRFLVEPMVVGRLLQAAEIGRTDVALNIGCATGFDAAVLGRVCLSVVAIDGAAELVEHATRILGKLDIDNVAVIEGKLLEGYPDQAPYDVIYFGGAVQSVPQRIFDQLGDPGRLLVVLTDGRGMGRAVIFLKTDGVVSRRVLFEAGTPTLPGFSEETPFVF